MKYNVGFDVAHDAYVYSYSDFSLLFFVFYSMLCQYSTLNRGNVDQNPSYFEKPLIGSCSGPWGNMAPITKDSLSSPLHECQKPEGKIAGEALVESS